MVVDDRSLPAGSARMTRRTYITNAPTADHTGHQSSNTTEHGTVEEDKREAGWEGGREDRGERKRRWMWD